MHIDTNSPRTPAGSRRSAWHQFFFADEVPYGLALVRIFLPWTLMHNVVSRWPWARELYSADGAPAPLADNFGFPGFLPEFSGPVAVGIYTLMACLFVTSSIGWCTRFSMLASAVLYFYFSMIDCMSTITKYTVIAVHLQLLLGISECGSIWSVDAWLRRRVQRNVPGLFAVVDDPRAPVWPQRLMQILLGVIYFGAAITKMHTPAFFSGDQLMYWMMTYLNNPHPLGDYLTQHPVIIVVFSYITIVWEITFLFIVWRKWLRVPVLLVGMMFHVMTAFTLGLIVFPIMMVSAYLSFVTEADVYAARAWFRRVGRQLGWGARNLPAMGKTVARAAANAAPLPRYVPATAFAFVLALLALGGIETEHWMDVYGQRGPDGPLPLREISDEEAQRLLGRELPLRQADKFLAFDLGTITIGEHLLNRRQEFRQGECVIAQITLHSPHEDLWVDCNLYDTRTEEEDEGRKKVVPHKIVQRMGQVVPRELLRSHFGYILDSALEPGEYMFVLRSAGQEIARRKFTLTPAVRAAAAN